MWYLPPFQTQGHSQSAGVRTASSHEISGIPKVVFQANGFSMRFSMRCLGSEALTYWRRTLGARAIARRKTHPRTGQTGGRDLPEKGVLPSVFVLMFVLVLAGLLGCRASAPLHVWAPPHLESTVGKRVVVAGIDGPKEWTEPLLEQLFEQAPSDPGRQLALVKADELPPESNIRLVSAESDMVSDVALHHVAKVNGYDFVLRGEVLRRRHQPLRTADDDVDADPEPLTVSWHLSEVRGTEAPLGRPLSLTYAQAIETHPDLAEMEDRKAALIAAAARETNRLIIPSIQRNHVRLSVPFGLPGSRAVRRANKLAQQGRWGEAKVIWQEVADTNPVQVSALLNLALAYAAEQDFTSAKRIARQAIRRSPSKLGKETLVWIELRQRDYHRAFGLADPPEGWFVTR